MQEFGNGQRKQYLPGIHDRKADEFRIIGQNKLETIEEQPLKLVAQGVLFQITTSHLNIAIVNF